MGRRSRFARRAVAAIVSVLAAACLDSPEGDENEVQLLDNADFEDGVSSWEFMGAVEVAPAEELGLSPSPGDGARVALLGGDDTQDDLMWQEVAVPDWVSQLVLSGNRCYVTSEPFDDEWDFFTISIQPAGGASEVLLRESNLQASATACEWEVFRVVTAAHAGEEIRLTLEGTTDGTGPTSFAVDGLALTATR